MKPRPLTCALACALLLALGTGTVHADRLHLENGRYIDVESWWTDGDWLRYDSTGGTLGIPRSMVVRIEEGPGPRDRPETASHRTVAKPAEPHPDDIARARAFLDQGMQALEQRDFETASSRYRAAYQEVPELSAARVGYAVAEIALGRNGAALAAILDGLALDAQNAELHEVLGDLRYRDERVVDALASWKRALALKPSDRLQQKIDKGERDQQASRNYDYAATSHFTLRYDGDVDQSLATAVTDYLEDEYWTLTSAYSHSPRQPITVLLYPRQAFSDVTQAGAEVGGLYDGKIRVPLGGLNRLDPRAKRVLAHELTHAVVHSKTRGNCPRWLHEGLAQITEGRQIGAADREKILKRLGEVDPADWESKGFSYPVALSLTRWLESQRGFDGLVSLLEALGRGTGIDDALKHLYGGDYANLCDRWARSTSAETRR